MKRFSHLFLFAILALFSTISFAQEVEETKEVKAVAKKMIQDKVEVNLADLPEAVTKTLSEQFADYTAEKAYKAIKYDKEVFYVKLKKQGKLMKALIDAEGNVVDKKDADIK